MTQERCSKQSVKSLLCTLPNNLATLPQKRGCGSVPHSRAKEGVQHDVVFWLLGSWMLTRVPVSARTSVHRANATRTQSVAKKVAMSRARRSGSSVGAKCPPLGMGVH